MFMYFDLDYYFIMLRQLWREPPSRRRRKVLFTLLITVPGMYLFHAMFFFLDKLLFPGLWFQHIREPVFIVGHARSGTTLMHRLMAADGERFSYFLYWEMFFPSLTQKKLLRLLGLLDRTLLNSYFYKRLKAWDKRTFDPMREIHNTGLWVPEEDNFVMTYAFASGYWILQAPYMQHLDMFRVDNFAPKKRRRWLNYYKECVRRQLYLSGGNKTHLSKNPVFCGWVESLIETFPDAKVVVMMRNPFECMPSLLKLVKIQWHRGGWPESSYRESLRILAEQSYDCYRLPQAALAAHPEVPGLIVDYRELVAQPDLSVKAIYQELGLAVSPQYERVLAEEASRARSHSSSHRYSLEEFGLNAEMIRTALADFFDSYGWESEEQLEESKD